MLQFQDPVGGIVVLNLSASHIDPNTGLEAASEVTALLEMLQTVQHNARLSEFIVNAVEDVFDSNVCVSPFLLMDGKFNSEICKIMVKDSAIGDDLMARLKESGALLFLEKIKERVYAEAFIWRILSVVCLSSCGLSTIDTIPKKLLHAIVDWFRSADGLTWRKEILGKNPVKIQCLRNTIIGLADITNDLTLHDKAKVHRSYTIQDRYLKTWQSFANSSDPLEMELASRLKVALRDTSIKPSKTRQAVMDIRAWLLSTQPTMTSLFEVMQKRNSGLTVGFHAELSRLGA